MITIIVPIYNERENIESLVQEIFRTTEDQDLPVSEVIYVDDASIDGSWDVLKELRKKYSFLRIIRHKNNSGQSAALWTGVRSAVNDIIVTLDGDGQNPPAEIKLLWMTYGHHKDTLPRFAVLGERTKRNDNWLRRFSSRFANSLRASFLKDQTRDTGCSLKLFRRKDYLNLPYFDHMHRFLPALLIREGVKLIHVGVSHRPRIHGHSKYGTIERALFGINDILGVLWLQRRACKAQEDETYEELI